MIPGTVTRITETTVPSADKIVVKSDLVRVTGSTTINTIQAGLGSAQPQLLILVPVDGAVTLGTSGNILVGVAMAVNRTYYLTFSKLVGKWYINS